MDTEFIDHILAQRRCWRISHEEVTGILYEFIYHHPEISSNDVLKYLRDQPEEDFSKNADIIEELISADR